MREKPPVQLLMHRTRFYSASIICCVISIENRFLYPFLLLFRQRLRHQHRRRRSSSARVPSAEWEHNKTSKFFQAFLLVTASEIKFRVLLAYKLESLVVFFFLFVNKVCSTIL